MSVEGAEIWRAPAADHIPGNAINKNSPILNAIFTAPPKYESCVGDKSCGEYAEHQLNTQGFSLGSWLMCGGESRANCRTVQVPFWVLGLTHFAMLTP